MPSAVVSSSEVSPSLPAAIRSLSVRGATRFRHARQGGLVSIPRPWPWRCYTSSLGKGESTRTVASGSLESPRK
jgi:hypothetical protein